MRTEALPHFRKLYGTIEKKIKKGETLVFDVDASFWVRGFGGKKWLVATTGDRLGASVFLGWAYVALGAACFGLMGLFVYVQAATPRVLGDLSLAVDG